jgi:hypothetical protein
VIDQAILDGGMLQQAFLLLLALTGKASGGLFSPVVHGDRSRGRIAVLFYDNTFSIFDLVSTNKGDTMLFSRSQIHC